MREEYNCVLFVSHTKEQGVTFVSMRVYAVQWAGVYLDVWSLALDIWSVGLGQRVQLFLLELQVAGLANREDERVPRELSR